MTLQRSSLVDSSFTVVDQLLRGRKAERVALMDNPWPETERDWGQQGYPMWAVPVRKQVGEHFWRCDDGRWEEVTQAVFVAICAAAR